MLLFRSCGQLTVRRIAQRIAAYGVTGSVDRKRGPHGPRKVTPASVAELRRAVDDELTERAAQRRLQQHLKVKLSRPQVHRVMHQLKQALAEQPALELLPVAAGRTQMGAPEGRTTLRALHVSRVVWRHFGGGRTPAGASTSARTRSSLRVAFTESFGYRCGRPLHGARACRFSPRSRTAKSSLI